MPAARETPAHKQGKPIRIKAGRTQNTVFWCLKDKKYQPRLL